MRVLIAGAKGQLGLELQATRPSNLEAVFTDLPELDIGQESNVRDFFRNTSYDWLINVAAYTAVDQAESDVDLAYRINRDGPSILASVCKEHGTRFIQISTDFVFDGLKSSPYLPDDSPNPISVYGASKFEGELAVQRILGPGACIMRTSWLYGAHGHNFVKTILQRLQNKNELTIVSDQVGTPTWANSLAGAIWKAVDVGLSGIHHLTDAGVASWYDLACAVQEKAVDLGALQQTVPIRPIRTKDFPTPARRPAYSVLDKTGTWEALGILPLHWRTALHRMLEGLINA